MTRGLLVGTERGDVIPNLSDSAHPPMIVVIDPMTALEKPEGHRVGDFGLTGRRDLCCDGHVFLLFLQANETRSPSMFCHWPLGL